MHLPRDSLIFGFLLFAWLIVLPGTANAETWQYHITAADTSDTIDTDNTTAVVDTIANEIRLPNATIKAISAYGNGYDHVVLTPNRVLNYSWDGSSLVENTIVEVSGLSNPIGVIAANPYPDVVVGTQTAITRYSFGGTSMVPTLSVSGLTGVVSIGSRGNDMAVLKDNKVVYYGSTGSDMAEIPMLSITQDFSNPIDIALVTDNYDCVVLDGKSVKYYSFTGSEMVENPYLAITGLVNPKMVSTDDGKIAVLDGNSVKTYTFNGGNFSYSSALSVTSGLTSPRCITLVPGTNDLILVDGTDVKYYMFDGNQMVLNPMLSHMVAELQDLGGYMVQAVAQSKACISDKPVTNVRVQAKHELPNKTSVTWKVSSDDGATWITMWRVVGLPDGGSQCEVTTDNGATWESIGDASTAEPGKNSNALWAKVPQGTKIRWQAVLNTEDTKETPKIKAPIIIETNNPPDEPEIKTPDECYATTTPTFTWEFKDPNEGDKQSAYQVIISTKNGTEPGDVLLDTGKVLSSETSFSLPASGDATSPSMLWSTGDYHWFIQVRTWDMLDEPSPISNPVDFCVIAYERPIVKEIIDPALTNQLIEKGAAGADLPPMKAGAKTVVTVDSIGPITTTTARFPYLGHESTVGPVQTVEANGINKCWQTEFWTNASLDVCPVGTIIGAEFKGTTTNGQVEMYLRQPRDESDVCWWAEGITRVVGSMYAEWSVILQGRKN